MHSDRAYRHPAEHQPGCASPRWPNSSASATQGDIRPGPRGRLGRPDDHRRRDRGLVERGFDAADRRELAATVVVEAAVKAALAQAAAKVPAAGALDQVPRLVEQKLTRMVFEPRRKVCRRRRQTFLSMPLSVFVVFPAVWCRDSSQPVHACSSSTTICSAGKPTCHRDP